VRNGVVAPGEREVFVLGQRAFQLRLVAFDGRHGVPELPGDIDILGQSHQVVITRFFGQPETAFFDSNILDGPFAPPALELFVLGLDGVLVLLEFAIGELEEDEAQHRRAVFVAGKVRVGAQLVSALPESVFKLFDFVRCHYCYRTAQTQYGQDQPI
jgi:hypothetical protein